MRRPRGPGGRFLTAAEIAQLESQKKEAENNDVNQHDPAQQSIPQQQPQQAHHAAHMHQQSQSMSPTLPIKSSPKQPSIDIGQDVAHFSNTNNDNGLSQTLLNHTLLVANNDPNAMATAMAAAAAAAMANSGNEAAGSGDLSAANAGNAAKNKAKRPRRPSKSDGQAIGNDTKIKGNQALKVGDDVQATL
jgi:hypothetical protein